MEVLPLTGGAAFGTLRAAARGRAGWCACVADRDLTAAASRWTFFGEPARMPAGPAVLAVQTGRALLPVDLWYDAGRGWGIGRIHPAVRSGRSGTGREGVPRP